MTYASEVLADSPLVYYRLDETSGTTAVDSSGNGRDATHTGSLTVGAGSLVASDPAGCAVDYAGGYTRRSAAAWMESPTAITVEAIIRPVSATLSGSHAVASRWVNSSPAGQRWILWVNAGKVQGYIYDSTSQTRSVDGATSLVAGETYYLALTFDGSTLRLHVNGVLDGSTAYTGSISTAGSSAWLDLARVSDAAAGTMRIDEFAFYGGVLSDTRISDHYAAMSASAGVTVSLALAGTLPATESSLTLASYTDTATGNRANGRIRNGGFVDGSDTPVSAQPATVVRGQRMTKALAYPTPDLVDGRPT